MVVENYKQGTCCRISWIITTEIICILTGLCIYGVVLKSLDLPQIKSTNCTQLPKTHYAHFECVGFFPGQNSQETSILCSDPSVLLPENCLPTIPACVECENSQFQWLESKGLICYLNTTTCRPSRAPGEFQRGKTFTTNTQKCFIGEAAQDPKCIADEEVFTDSRKVFYDTVLITSGVFLAIMIIIIIWACCWFWGVSDNEKQEVICCGKDAGEFCVTQYCVEFFTYGLTYGILKFLFWNLPILLMIGFLFLVKRICCCFSKLCGHIRNTCFPWTIIVSKRETKKVSEVTPQKHDVEKEGESAHPILQITTQNNIQHDDDDDTQDQLP